MQLNTGQWVVIIIAGVLILGFILGYYYNRQRAGQIFTWLKKGLSTLGAVTMGDRLPGMVTGGRLEVIQPSAPFKRVEAVYLLSPRENPLFLLFQLFQGRGDELIIWITYPSKPEQSIEIARKGDRQFVKRLQATDKTTLTMQEPYGNLQVAVEQIQGAQLDGKVLNFVDRYKSDLIRLAFRPEKPHLFLRVKLRVMSHQLAELFFADLKELGS